MYYRNVYIERDRFTSITKLIQSHEIPVLRQVFDKGSIREASGFVVNDRPYGNFSDEYRRLVNVYGYEAVHAAYPKESDMVEQIPLLARMVTTVLSTVKLPTFGRQEKASIPPLTTEEDYDYPKAVRGLDCGMLDAVNEGLRECGMHNDERGRFKNG